MTLALYSHAACAVAFLALTILLLRRAPMHGAGRFVAAASLATALWSGATAIDFALPLDEPLARWLTTAADTLQVLSVVGWLAFLGKLLGVARSGDKSTSRIPRPLILGLSLTIVLLAAVAIFVSIGRQGTGTADQHPFSDVLMFFSRLGLALIGLVLVENLSRNTSADQFWSIKFLCFGLGGVFAYDFFVYADAILFRHLDPELVDVRGAVNLIGMPLLAVAARRNPNWTGGFSASRHFVFHTATILGAGIYLLLMGAAGYFVRRLGGSSGQLLQTVFFFAALMLLILVLSSGMMRSYAKVIISKHLFAYKYDYREEWLRFINTVAMDDAGSVLGQRVVQAIANIVDSPGGALWQWDDATQSYAPVAEWNYREVKGREPVDGKLAKFLVRKGWVIEVDSIDEHAKRYAELELPAWFGELRDPWLIVPLFDRERLLGFLVLRAPRAPRDINWEDYDLLKTVGRQAASYLGEQAAMRALTDARQIELFNRRFAFVIHDLKTLISQLSLMLSNADKHGGNPEFQRDLLQSVREAVGSMSRVLAQINAERKKEKAAALVDIAELARRIIVRRPQDRPTLVLHCSNDDLRVIADEMQVAAVVNHLIQNATEAAGEDGKVDVRLFRADGMIELEVQDDGPGMDAAFIQNNLFRPFNSTKETGYGIGAYQCRELVKEMKGYLAVNSVPGEGTIMRVSLPAAGVGQGSIAQVAVKL